MSGASYEHWLTHTGPAAWYRISYPPTWSASESEGVLSLSPPGGNGHLSIKCSWRDRPGSENLRDFLDIERLFPHRRKVRMLKAPAVSVDAVAMEGLARVKKSEPWWKAWLTPTVWHPWRMWAFRSGRLYVSALWLEQDRPDPDLASMVMLILQSLTLNENPADPPDHFTRRVIEFAKSHFPGLSCEPAPDFQLKVGDSCINLFNFYRSYINAPDQFEAIVRPALTTMVQVQNWGKDQLEPDLHQVRDRIMPMLYPEDVWKERFPNFVASEWVGGLVVLYVVDEAHAYWYLRDDLVSNWGLTSDELYDIAKENLETYFENSPMEFTAVGEEDNPQIVLPTRPDAYNTARLLSHSFREKLQEILGREFVVGVPNRDFFVAVNLQAQEQLEQIKRKVADDFQSMDHPLTSQLLRVSSDGVSAYFDNDE